MRQQRIFAIIIICLMLQQLEGKSLRPNTNLDRQNQRVKRGYSKYGQNEYGSTIQVSSGVLQYGKTEEADSIDAGAHYDISSINEDPWKSSGLSSGYDVWLEPSAGYHPSTSYSDSQASSISSSHPGSDYISNIDFSAVAAHSAHPEVPASQLHTQIISSSGSVSGSSSHSIGDHSISTISDNIDFNNVADIKSKHYAKSYGK